MRNPLSVQHLIMKTNIVLVLLLCASASLAAKVFHVTSAKGTYKMSYWEAHQACGIMGAHLATQAELEELRQTNFSLCACGWTLDKTAWFPMTTAVDGCGDAPGLHQCYWQDHWDAWCYKGDSIGDCTTALGIESGKIDPSQIYATSEYKHTFLIFFSNIWSAQVARLHNKDMVNAWIPAHHHRRDQHMEVDLEKPTAVTGILTQGASRYNVKMWVTKYLIKFSKDGHNYKTVQEGGIDKKFDGNVDNDGLKRNMFPEPVLARYIQIQPLEYHNRIALRIELLGCDLEVYEAAQAMSRDIVVTNVGGEEKPPSADVFLTGEK
ncbi:retinoschisin-like [Styela clava]|uniref:lactadherin-like n=1 Tax=Styela clava TaxID=7725 RepID=UPI0019392F2E|nr:lactadherin-like [Styela clava]